MVKIETPIETGRLCDCRLFLLGLRGFWGDNFWSGLIDDVRIYNRALTAVEIAFPADWDG